MLLDILRHDPPSAVLFVTNDFPPAKGGIQTFVRQLCDELPAERIVVHAPAHPDAAAYDHDLPFVVVRDPTSTLLPTPAVARRVIGTAHEHDCRQVVFGSSVPLGLLAPALRRAGLRWQVALTHGHEVWWAGLPGTRQALLRVARAVDVMTYVSDYTGRRLSGSVGSATRRFVKLSPRADPRFNPGRRRRLGEGGARPGSRCAGGALRRSAGAAQGTGPLIRIWPRVLEQFPGARLLIVGDGPDRARLTRMVRRRRLEGRVSFTGEVEDTLPYYAASDVFSMPVRNRLFGLEVEGLGISFLEAAACGLTVVPGRHGGALEASTRPRHDTGGGPRSTPGVSHT